MKPTTTSEKTITVTPRKGTVLLNFFILRRDIFWQNSMIYKECFQYLDSRLNPKIHQIVECCPVFFFSIKICVDTVFLKKKQPYKNYYARAIYKSASGFLSDQDLKANVSLGCLLALIYGVTYLQSFVLCVEFWYLAWPCNSICGFLLFFALFWN